MTETVFNRRDDLDYPQKQKKERVFCEGAESCVDPAFMLQALTVAAMHTGSRQGWLGKVRISQEGGRKGSEQAGEPDF